MKKLFVLGIIMASFNLASARNCKGLEGNDLKQCCTVENQFPNPITCKDYIGVQAPINKGLVFLLIAGVALGIVFITKYESK